MAAGLAADELFLADRETVRERRVERRTVGKAEPRIEFKEFAIRHPALGERFLIFIHHHLTAQAEIVRTRLAPGFSGFVAVGVEDFDHPFLRMKAGRDFSAAARCLAC